MTATTLAFDRLAPRYDALADGDLFRLMRQRTHAVFTRTLRPGARVLDIGCGTGRDTAFLAARGARVVACDPSEAMVSRTLLRLARAGTIESARVLPCGLENLEAFLDALDERGPFDGIVSNFGALNCVASLVPLQRLVAQRLRPGGVLLLGLMSRTCATEIAYFVVSRRWRQLLRRHAACAVPVDVAGISVPTFYHRPKDVARLLRPHARLAGRFGVGVAIPPPYLESRWQQVPVSVRAALEAVDAAVTPLPLANRLGDHVLLEFVRSPADA
jgi:SAM-dependent methyltransferase